MERLLERLRTASTALATLEEVERLQLPPTASRDVAIMRFIYTFEAVWRTLQRYLAVLEGVETETPKSAMRAAFEAGLLTAQETEAALAMVDDRNRTVHIYNERLANAIFGRVSTHAEVLRTLITAMSARLSAD